MDARTVQRALRAATIDAGIIKRHVTVHTLRHYGERYKMVSDDSKPAKSAN